MVNDRYLPARDLEPVPTQAAQAGGARIHTRFEATAASGSTHRRVTVPGRLVQLQHRGEITASREHAYLQAWRGALGTEHRLHGWRHSELGSVIAIVESITARHALSPSRLRAVFLTLKRNVEWWTRGPLLSPGQRVEFSGSQLVWEYYAGQGIQLQELGSFGKADGLYSAGRSHTYQLKTLLGELIPLAARRAGGPTWEYYFNWEGGRPPWVSAMAQGTALEALTRAYRATGNRSYLDVAHHALGILRTGPGTGVAVRAPHGTRFLQYSFAPGADIINAFLQTLIGLYDYARYSGDPVAARLFRAGNAQAEAEVPRFDTGAWSLYQPGIEDDLSYHELVTGFLHELCARTDAGVYCRTARRFQADLHTPPKITQLTQKATPRRAVELRFRLSKVSRVGIVLLHGSQTILSTSAQFPHGVHAFSVPPLRRGTYTVHLGATDLAGNFHRVTGSLVVAPRRQRH